MIAKRDTVVLKTVLSKTVFWKTVLWKTVLWKRCALLFVVLVGVMGFVGLTSCDHNNRSRKVSSSLFLTPVADTSGPTGRGITVLATELDFLRVNEPDRLPGDFEDEATESSVLSRLEGDDVLVYERRSGSLFSADVGRNFANPDCAHDSNDNNADGQPDCERIKLHYNAEGFSEEIRTQPAVISTDVPPIRLKNGWVLAFEFTTKTLLAFRKEPPRMVVGNNGQPVLLPYRSTRDPANLNFGRGNGLILSEVLSGRDLQAVANVTTVARFFEIEENKVLIFFSTGAAIHLLDLREVEADVDFDLQIDDPQARDIQSVKLLKGDIRLVPVGGLGGGLKAFLTFSDIAAATGNVNVKVNDFPPATIPTDGSALLYDQSSSNFVRVRALHPRNPATGQPLPEINGSVVVPAVLASTLIRVLQGSFRPGEDETLTMSGSFANPDTRRTEILVMEEMTNNLLAYDYTKPLDANLRIFVSQGDIVSRRDPVTPPSGTPDIREPLFLFAVRDIQDNRLTFDDGRDQLVAISYTAGLVVVVLGASDLTAITQEPVASLTYLQPLDDNTVRALDSASSFLLSLRLKYAAIPVNEKEN